MKSIGSTPHKGNPFSHSILPTSYVLLACFILLFVCFLRPATGQRPGSSLNGPGATPPAAMQVRPPRLPVEVAGFTFDLLTFKPQASGNDRDARTSADSVRLDVYIAVPFESLEFLYAG